MPDAKPMFRQRLVKLLLVDKFFGFSRRPSSEDRGFGSLPFALASPEPANRASSSQRIAIPKPPVCHAYSSMALAIQKWRRQNPPPSRNFFRTEGNIMPSCRKEWIPLRSAACTALQIAQPPTANALAKVLRVNHRPCPGPDCFSTSLLGFKGRPLVKIPIGVRPVQNRGRNSKRSLILGNRCRDMTPRQGFTRLSGVISCARLCGGNSGFGELLHRLITT
jgi:hypothetical protein